MIAVEVEDESWRVVKHVEAVVSQSVEVALSSPSPLRGGSGWGAAAGGVGVAPHPNPPLEGEGDVTFLLANDEAVRDLNARFRGRDAPTNVLSFPAPDSARPHLGDVALAYGVCAREAGEQGKTLSDHLSHLVVHGVLHLLGYDHEADARAEVMEAMERDILARLGIADPYRRDGVRPDGADARP